MAPVIYEIWQARCDVPSEWDGGGRFVENVDSREEAERAVAECQIGGHAAWIVELN